MIYCGIMVSHCDFSSIMVPREISVLIEQVKDTDKFNILIPLTAVKKLSTEGKKEFILKIFNIKETEVIKFLPAWTVNEIQ